MRVLIVEDNAFNANCLRRMMELSVSTLSVGWVSNSQEALSWIETHNPDLVIIDGDLGASDELNCNGPVLADRLLKDNPTRPVITWSNCSNMHDSFTAVRLQHDQTPNELNTWPKKVSQEHILKTLHHYSGTQITPLGQPDYHVQHT